MKFEVGKKTQEGFDSSYVIIFENGLMLSTQSVLWLCVEEREAVKEKFEEVITFLSKTCPLIKD